MNHLKTLFSAIAIAVTAAGPTCALAGAPATHNHAVAAINEVRTPGFEVALHNEDSGSFWLSQQGSHSAQSRSQVKAETIAARRAGDIAMALHGEDSGSMRLGTSVGSSGLTRAQVLAEVKQARERGELHAMVGEDSGAALLGRQRAWAAALYAGPNMGAQQDGATPNA